MYHVTFYTSPSRHSRKGLFSLERQSIAINVTGLSILPLYLADFEQVRRTRTYMRTDLSYHVRYKDARSTSVSRRRDRVAAFFSPPFVEFRMRAKLRAITLLPGNRCCGARLAPGGLGKVRLGENE